RRAGALLRLQVWLGAEEIGLKKFTPFCRFALHGETRSIRGGFGRPDFDQIESYRGRIVDRTGAFLVSPALRPDEGMYAELIHVYPPIESLPFLFSSSSPCPPRVVHCVRRTRPAGNAYPKP